MSKNLWLAALASLALGAPAMAQGAYGSTGGTDQQGTTEQGAQQPGSIGDQGQQGATGQQGSVGQANPAQPGSTFASNQLTGKIQNVDPNAKSLTIADANGQQESLKMGQNATVFMQGKLGSFQDLKEGQQVRAAYENQNGQKTLRWIEVNPTAKPGATDQQAQPPATDQGMQQDQAAPGGGSDTADSQQGAMQGKQITGKVVSVQPDQHQLVLSHSGQKLTLDVQKDAKVFVYGQKASLSDLKEGEDVRAAFESADQKKVVRIDTIGQKSSKSDSAQPKQQDKNY